MEELENFIENIKVTHRESIKSIQDLAESIEASRLFVAVFTLMSLYQAGGSEITHGDTSAKLELLAYHLFPFFDVSTKREITPWHTQACIESLDKLFVSRIQERTFAHIGLKGGGTPAEGIGESIRTHTEIVRGSAYPEQTSEEINSIQGKFGTWFEDMLGLNPQQAVNMVWDIGKTEEKKLNSFSFKDKVKQKGESYEEIWIEAKNKSPIERTTDDQEILKIFKDKNTARYFGIQTSLDDLSPDLLPISYGDLGLKVSDKEWNSLINLIGLTTETRKLMSDPIEVRQRPLFVLPDNRVLLGDISNALDALYDAFEKTARKDRNFYDRRYQKTKAEWLEEKVFENLSHLFPSKYMFRKLHYPDPDKEDGATAELDMVVHWSPFLILIENKAVQFRMESRLGDVARLRTDIKANVEDAFEQARRALRYITKVENPEFIEHLTGRKLSFRKEDIHRIYLLTVSQHHLAGIANRLSIVEGLGLFKEKEYPFSICAADLDIIAEFCQGPDVFLHYIEKRLQVQRSSIEIIADELDLFGAYLKTRLQPERLWGNEKIDGAALSGFSQIFDEHMKFRRGELQAPPNIALEVPNEIAEILLELRGGNEKESRWIAFALLSLSDNCLAAIAQLIRKVRQSKLTPGMFRRATHQEGDTAISIVASLDLPPSELRERTIVRTAIEKYRRRVFRSIGFGIMVADSSRPFHCAIWTEGQWAHDDKIEGALADEPDFVPVEGAKLPGRNAPCICGSGKKFKKCCLSKIEAAHEKGVR